MSHPILVAAVVDGQIPSRSIVVAGLADSIGNAHVEDLSDPCRVVSLLAKQPGKCGDRSRGFLKPCAVGGDPRLEGVEPAQHGRPAGPTGGELGETIAKHHPLL